MQFLCSELSPFGIIYLCILIFRMLRIFAQCFLLDSKYPCVKTNFYVIVLSNDAYYFQQKTYDSYVTTFYAIGLLTDTYYFLQKTYDSYVLVRQSLLLGACLEMSVTPTRIKTKESHFDGLVINKQNLRMHRFCKWVLIQVVGSKS